VSFQTAYVMPVIIRVYSEHLTQDGVIYLLKIRTLVSMHYNVLQLFTLMVSTTTVPHP
jgi:hypothetical protein